MSSRQAHKSPSVPLTARGPRRNALLMNALSTPSHLPSRQPSASRNSSVADIHAEEEQQRNARLEAFNQQVGDTSPQPRVCSHGVCAGDHSIWQTLTRTHHGAYKHSRPPFVPFR